jgi:5-methylcytosine-specific restriction enzyme A
VRQEFTKATKLEAWTRSGGRCQCCTAKLFPGNIEYHHDKECTYGGSNDSGNCIVLCRACHSAITRKRTAAIAKSNRVRAGHLGIKRTSRPMPGSRASGWRKRMDGTVERRPLSGIE